MVWSFAESRWDETTILTGFGCRFMAKARAAHGKLAFFTGNRHARAFTHSAPRGQARRRAGCVAVMHAGGARVGAARTPDRGRVGRGAVDAASARRRGKTS